MALTAYTQTESGAESGFTFGATNWPFCAGGLSDAATTWGRTATVSGTPGTTADVIKINHPNTGNKVAICFTIDPEDSATWDTDTAIIRLDVDIGNAELTWEDTYLCRVNSVGVNQETIGSTTGQATDLEFAGLKTMNVSCSSTTPSAGDRLVIILAFDSPGAHGNAQITCTPGEDMDIPINPVAGGISIPVVQHLRQRTM